MAVFETSLSETSQSLKFDEFISTFLFLPRRGFSGVINDSFKDVCASYVEALDVFSDRSMSSVAVSPESSL